LIVAASFVDEVNSGDQRRALEALRGHLADTLLVAPPQAVAALGARLQMVLAKLAALDAGVEGSKIDELAAARVARRAGAADSAPAGKRAQPRRGNGSNRTG
jgi:hypothetical protein